jgi:hypothetical protein
MATNNAFLPHASLDFDRRDAPRDLLNIFGALRNSLRRQRDERGHALTLRMPGTHLDCAISIYHFRYKLSL